MDLAEALLALREDTLLSSMPTALADRVGASAAVRSVAAEAQVCREGQPADRLVIPIDGTLRLARRDGGGDGRLGRKRALNLGAVLRGATWEYTAVADGALHVLEVDAAIFRAALEAEPAYRRYLSIVAERRSVREAVRALRRAGARAAGIQRLIGAAHPSVVAAGAIVEPGWVLVDEGRCELVVDHAGEEHVVAVLAPGEFYGGAAHLGGGRDLVVRGAAPGQVLAVPAAALRGIVDGDAALERALKQELPDVHRRVRRALVEVGAEFTRVMAPVGARDEAAPRAIGTALALGVSGRRLDGLRATSDDDSGAVALTAILKLYERTVALSAVRRALERRQPPTLLDLAQVAERHGFSTHPGKLARVAQLRRLVAPLLTVVDHRYVVVLEVRGGVARVFDPLFGARVVRLRELASRSPLVVLELRDARDFLGHVVPPPPEERTDGEPSVTAPSTRRRAWEARFAYLRLLGRDRAVILAAALLATVLLFVGLLGPRLNALVLDGVLVHGDAELLRVVTIGLLLVSAMTFVLTGLRQVCLSYLSATIDHQLSTLTIRHSLGVALEHHGDNRVGTVMSRMGELVRIRASLVEDLLDIVFQLAGGALALVWLFTYSGKLGALALVAVPAAYAVIRSGGVRYRRLYLRLFKQGAKMQSQTTEQVESVATIKALAGGAAAQARWEQTLVDGIELQRELLRVRLGTSVGMQVLEEAIRVGALYVGVSLVLGHELSAGGVLAASQYLSAALHPLIGLAGKLDELEQLGISFRKLDELFELPIEDEERGPGRAEPTFDGEIVARGLTFRYATDTPAVVKDLSFTIGRGQTVAIVGRSGSGKSTLAKLLQGGLSPTSGELLYDDQSTRGVPISALRRNVGIVMQDSQLFAGTIADNIAYGDDAPDDERVREAARLAAAQDFITKFPNGYDTYLAEGGLGLSGGQRQRISIARALYRDPKVLILDEATSALDAESERAIMGNMRDILRGRTAIVIAHRLHTVKNADRILVLDQGEIVEQGTHAELIARRGLYHSLFSQQFNQA